VGVQAENGQAGLGGGFRLGRFELAFEINLNGSIQINFHIISNKTIQITLERGRFN
jgi:hypothetical protein